MAWGGIFTGHAGLALRVRLALRLALRVRLAEPEATGMTQMPSSAPALLLEAEPASETTVFVSLSEGGQPEFGRLRVTASFDGVYDGIANPQNVRMFCPLARIGGGLRVGIPVCMYL